MSNANNHGAISTMGKAKGNEKMTETRGWGNDRCSDADQAASRGKNREAMSEYNEEEEKQNRGKRRRQV